MAQAGFNEKVKQTVKDNFDQSSQIYNAFEEKHHFSLPLALKLAESIGLQHGTSVLDVGCGSGISAKVLNKYFSCRVVGVDLSEKMVEAGRLLCDSPDIHLVVGDGEKLASVVGDRVFDYVLYNASIFIFPDVEHALMEATGCLRPGGKIAFSFYPLITGELGEDLLAVAFRRLGEAEPRFRVITNYAKACQALEYHCGTVTGHRWVMPLDVGFTGFFSIPAQSASLFPDAIMTPAVSWFGSFFSTLSDVSDRSSIVWRMAEGVRLEAKGERS